MSTIYSYTSFLVFRKYSYTCLALKNNKGQQFSAQTKNLCLFRLFRHNMKTAVQSNVLCRLATYYIERLNTRLGIAAMWRCVTIASQSRGKNLIANRSTILRPITLQSAECKLIECKLMDCKLMDCKLMECKPTFISFRYCDFYVVYQNQHNLHKGRLLSG